MLRFNAEWTAMQKRDWAKGCDPRLINGRGSPARPVCSDFSWLQSVASLQGSGQDPSEMRVLLSTIRQGGPENFFAVTATVYTEREGKVRVIFLGFYDLLWGKGVLVSMTLLEKEEFCFLWVASGEKEGQERVREGDLVAEVTWEAFQSPLVQSTLHTKVPHPGVSFFSEPQPNRKQKSDLEIGAKQCLDWVEVESLELAVPEVSSPAWWGLTGMHMGGCRGVLLQPTSSVGLLWQRSWLLVWHGHTWTCRGPTHPHSS